MHAQELLLLATSLPWIFFVPGLLLTKILFPSQLDRLETISLAALFSLLLSHLGIYTLEEATRQMTALDITLTLAGINFFCALTYLARRERLSPARLLARLRGKLHKRD